MIDVNKIKLLLPDNVLVALTDDMDSGTINENLVNELINDGYNFVQGVAPKINEELKDEIVKNYVLSYLYAYAGLEEKAEKYQQLCLTMLKSFDTSSVVAGNVGVKLSSNARVFTDEELEKW